MADINLKPATPTDLLHVGTVPFLVDFPLGVTARLLAPPTGSGLAGTTTDGWAYPLQTPTPPLG